MNAPTFPVHVDAHLDPKLSRWLWLFKWLLALPHYFLLAFLWVAFLVLSVVAFFAILFTGRYPRNIFDFNVGVLRWSWRVAYYAYGALGTDQYPPFSLEEKPDYPAHLEVEYPEHLSRGLALVKWWLLAIPHYLVIGLFLGGAGFALNNDGSDPRVWTSGLIGLLVLVAGVVLLFTGRYPQPIFDFVLGLNRWVLRVAGYAALMTDEYPPFRLDQAGDEPGTLRTAAGPAPGDATRVQPPLAGRVITLVVASVLLVGSLGALGAGIGLASADNDLRDGDGFLMSDAQTISTDTYAIMSANLDVAADSPGDVVPHAVLGDAKVTAIGEPGVPLFVGLAPTASVEAYLGDVRHVTVDNLIDLPVSEPQGTEAPAVLPRNLDIWVAQTTGTGTQEVIWPIKTGEWTVLIMNADGSASVSADVAAGATVPALDWLVPTLLVGAGVGLFGSAFLLAFALRPRPPKVA
jgi:hypothetical protein